MTAAFDLLSDWRAYLLFVLVCGLTPGFALRILVRAYPRDHPRRMELIAELYAQRYLERPLFVAQQLETAISEGLPARWRSLRRAKPKVSLGERFADWRLRAFPSADEVAAAHLRKEEVLLHIDGTNRYSLVMKNRLVVLFAAVAATVAEQVLHGAAARITLGIMGLLGFLLVTIQVWNTYAHYLITDQRLVRVVGILRQHVESVPWSDIDRIIYRQSRFGQLMGYAWIYLPSVDGRQVWAFFDITDPAAFVRRSLYAASGSAAADTAQLESPTRGVWRNLGQRRRSHAELVMRTPG